MDIKKAVDMYRGSRYMNWETAAKLILGMTLERDIRDLGRRIPKDELEKKWDNGQFEYIPYAIDRFIALITMLQYLYTGNELLLPSTRHTARPRPRFMDIGGGIGDKSLIAYMLGFDAAMVEITPAYCDMAKEYFCGLPIDIIQGDALEQDYYGYNLVYMYEPMKDKELMKKLMEQVALTADRGTLIVNVFTGPETFNRIPDTLKSEEFVHCLVSDFSKLVPNYGTVLKCEDGLCRRITIGVT